MSLNNQNRANRDKLISTNLRMVGIAGQVGFLTLGIVLGSLFLGIYLDRLFGTKPAIMLILVLGSAPLAMVITYYSVMKTLKDIQAAKPDQIANKTYIEEEDSSG